MLEGLDRSPFRRNDSGLDPVEMAQKFSERLYSVHIKDFSFNPAGKPEDVVAGEGDPVNPVAELKEGLEKIKTLCS